MKAYRWVFLVVLVIAGFSFQRIQAQQHQTKNWHCVREPFVEDVEGNVLALQCEAALPNGENLDTEDEHTLSRLARIRFNAKDNDKQITDAVRMGFGQAVGQICQKHSNIVLAPLFPDLNTSKPILYGCKNIIAAPEK